MVVVLAVGGASAAASVAAANWLPGFLDALWTQEDDDPERTPRWMGALVEMQAPPRALWSPRNALLFAALILLAIRSAHAFGMHTAVCAATVFCGALAAAALIDIETCLLPDAIVLPLLWAGLLLNATGAGFVQLDMAVYGAAIAYVSLRVLDAGALIATGRNGMYNGDFKLFAAIGAWLGLKALLPVMIVALLVLTVFALARAVAGRAVRHEEVPFGPYLAIGGIVALECQPYMQNALHILR